MFLILGNSSTMRQVLTHFMRKWFLLIFGLLGMTWAIQNRKNFSNIQIRAKVMINFMFCYE